MKTAAFAATFVATLLAGCLPRGQAPAGRRWLPSRTVEQVLFAPGPDGEPARLVTTRQSVGTDFTGNDVYGVSAPADGETFGVETLLLDHVTNSGGTCVHPSCTLTTDSRGRLLLMRDETKSTMSGPLDPNVSLMRVDPLTGDKTDLGRQTYFVGLSPDRTIFAYQSDRTFVLRQLDDREVRFEPDELAQLVGSVVYVLTDGTLARLRPPYDARDELARDVDGFVVIPGGQTLLALCRRAPDALGCQGVVLDTKTGVETPLPADSAQPYSLSMSPSGRYLFGFGFGQAPGEARAQVLLLYDRQTATSQTTTVDGGVSGQNTWRPGHDEIWFTTQTSSWRWRPGEAPVKVGDAQPFLPFNAFGAASSSWPFTPDGRFWLSYEPNASHGDKPPVLLRSIDDASFAPLLVNPAGTAVQNVWPLADGRLIVEDRISNEKRSDIFLVDPAARTTRQLGHSGNVVATGATRILVFLDWLIGGGSGELTLIELETGARTLLAENVHAVAVEKSVGADALAPGTRIAFISRHRIESPYDGLWVAQLP